MAISVVVVRALVVTQRDHLSEDAFGGPIGFSRWLFRGDRPVAICGFCRTVNRDSAKFCKACDGKLPAFYAAGDAQAGLRAVQAAATPAVRSRLLPSLVLAVAVLVLFAVGWFWHEQHSAIALQAEATPSALPRIAQAPARAAPATMPPAAYGTVNSAVAPDAPPVEFDAAAAGTRADALRQNPRPQSAPRASTAGQLSDGPLARCAGLNFFSRAICMNDSCAVRANGRHPQCADVLRQRRIDEARRNPLLAD